MSDLIKGLEWRYATKEFDTNKKISNEDLEEIIEAFRLTSSSFGLEPWKLVIVENKEKREELLPVSWNQKQITEASHLLVFTRILDNEKQIDNFLENNSKITWASREDLKWYEDMMKWFFSRMDDSAKKLWAHEQVFIALWNVMTVLADKKIDSCAIWGFDPVKYDEILELDKLGLASVVVLPIWYRSENDKYAEKPKVRFSKEEIVIIK